MYTNCIKFCKCPTCINNVHISNKGCECNCNLLQERKMHYEEMNINITSIMMNNRILKYIEKCNEYDLDWIRNLKYGNKEL